MTLGLVLGWAGTGLAVVGTVALGTWITDELSAWSYARRVRRLDDSAEPVDSLDVDGSWPDLVERLSEDYPGDVPPPGRFRDVPPF